MTFGQLQAVSLELDSHIKKILKESGYMNHENLEHVDFDTFDYQQNFVIAELEKVYSHLAKAHDIMHYLQRPIEHEGELRLNEHERYECDGVELTCGSPIELLCNDISDDRPQWVRSRIEARHGKYYIVGHEHVKLDGLRVRLRKREW